MKPDSDMKPDNVTILRRSDPLPRLALVALQSHEAAAQAAAQELAALERRARAIRDELAKREAATLDALREAAGFEPPDEGQWLEPVVIDGQVVLELRAKA